MPNNDKEIGMLLKGVESLEEIVAEIKGDVKSLLGTRNKTYGAVAALSFLTSGGSLLIFKLLGWA